MLLVSIGTSQDADVHPPVHRQSPHTKNYPAPKPVVPELRNPLQRCDFLREKRRKKQSGVVGWRAEFGLETMNLVGRSSQGGSASLRR